MATAYCRDEHPFAADQFSSSVTYVKLGIPPAANGPNVANVFGKRQVKWTVLMAIRTCVAREGFAAFLAKWPAHWIPQ